MAFLNDGRSTAGLAAIETKTKALRVTSVPRGLQYTTAGITGTIAAALAANSTVFAMRMDPGATLVAFVERIRLQYTTIVAYTTAISAARRLHILRSTNSGFAPSGGTALVPVAKHSTFAPSEFGAAAGGFTAIATTGSLTMTSLTFDTANSFGVCSLAHLGAAGAYGECIFDFSDDPIMLTAGQTLAIQNPAAMDAAGTWQLSVAIDHHESVAYDSSTSD